jgi:hypothetical protein
VVLHHGPGNIRRIYRMVCSAASLRLALAVLT